MTQPQGVRDFVRDELGCGCPEEVFEAVQVFEPPRHLDGLPGDYLMEIGHRLLILVVHTTPWETVLQHLPALVDSGRDMREAQGLNRFRLVVASADTKTARHRLSRRFAALAGGDARLHLHVIAPSGLPQVDVEGG